VILALQHRPAAASTPAGREAAASRDPADVEREPIAIIGMACRFPGGADSPSSFWQILRDGVDAIREVPEDRWDVDVLYDPDPGAPGKMSTRWGGFLAGPVDAFDARFFGISPREAESMDPQQRLFLETAWAALEHAGQPPRALGGTRTGVYAGVFGHDYLALQVASRDAVNAHTGTGSNESILAGRLSFFLGLQGPSLVVNTACSSSLVAIHLAVQSLRGSECDLAWPEGST
jgi:acyl transferase domain-containing protein